MSHPIFVWLDETVQATLEAAAFERGVGLSSYLRELATAEARRLRRERGHARSRQVADHAASSPKAWAFYEDWGTPTAGGQR